MTPFFSVIIPLYNKEHFIEKTIQSVLNQSEQNFEIIIVNDGSTDSSLEKVEAIKDERTSVFTIKNQGVSHARNYGISKAKAHYIAFLDADDFWLKEFLKHMKMLIDKYPNESVFASALKIKTKTREYKVSYKELPFQSQDVVINYFEASQNYSILHCSSSVFKTSIFETVGHFDEELITGEDTDLWIRIGLKYKVIFTNTILAVHQVVNNGLTQTTRKQFKAIDFSKYDALINENSFAQYFLNQNRFSSAIRFKLLGDKENFRILKSQLNQNQLSVKRKTLLALPKSVLMFMINLNNKISSKKNYY